MDRQGSASGVPEKTMVCGGLPLANGQAVSAQIAEIQWAVGGPLVKPLADFWRFVRWATTNPLTTAAAASGSSVDRPTADPPADGCGWDNAKMLAANRGRTVRDDCSQ